MKTSIRLMFTNGWKSLMRLYLISSSMVAATVAALAQTSFSPATNVPTVVQVSSDTVGLGDRLSVVVEGPAEYLKKAASDRAKVVLLLDKIPLRGLCTNVVSIPLFNSTNVPQKMVERYVTNSIATNAEVFVSNALGYTFHREPKTIDIISTNLVPVSSSTNIEADGFDFVLLRSDLNREEWTALLGKPRASSKSVHLQIGVQSDNVLEVLNPTPKQITLIVLPHAPFFASKTVQFGMQCLCIAAALFLLVWVASRRSLSSLFDGSALIAWLVICLSVFCFAGPSWCWISVAIVFILGFFYLAVRTEMLRDDGPEPDKPLLRPFSLARTQMAVWFFLIVFAYVFLWLVTRSLGTITSTTLALMGIGAGTALGAAAQQSSKLNDLKAKKVKIDAIPAEQRTNEQREDLARYELATLDVDNAKKRREDLNFCIAKIDSELSDIDKNLEKEPAAIKFRTELEAKQQRTPAEEQSLNELRSFLAQIPIWASQKLELQKQRSAASADKEHINQLLSQRPISQGFLNDVLTDEVGISFHRFQMFIWTIVVAIIFITAVYDQLAMPEFSATLLALMGISSGTYLGFMITEPPASTDPFANVPK